VSSLAQVLPWTCQRLATLSLSAVRQSSDAACCNGQEPIASNTIMGSPRCRESLVFETNRLLSLSDKELSKVRINEFSEVMDAWSKHSATVDDAADYAFSLLKRLESNLEPPQGTRNRIHLRPDTASYNFVLQAFALSKGQSGGQKAQAILESMIARCREYALTTPDGALVPPEPNQLSFNIAINAWAKTGLERAGTKAEQIFSKMEDWHYECIDYKCFHGAAPNSRSVCAVMDAWAQSKSNEAAERVMAILQVVVENKTRQLEGKISLPGTVVTPVVIMFNSAIHAWVHSNKGKEGAIMAEEILGQLVKFHQNKVFGEVDEMDENDIGLAPTTRTFSLVIDAWARSEMTEKNGEGAKRAEKILEDMIDLYREGVPVKPNVVTFTTVASAWARCQGSIESAERSEAVLNTMLKLYEETGDIDFKPNEATANTVITAWARSGRVDAADRAEAILQKMEEYCHPNVITYNSVLGACSATGNFQKVIDVFQRLRNNNKIEADEISYNTVISAAAKTQTLEGATTATRLLEEMESLYEQGNRRMRPSAFTYSPAINAWSKSNCDDQAERAHDLFQRMLLAAKTGKLSGTVDVVVFTTFISACANLPKAASPYQKEAAMRYALQAFELLHSDFGGRPNQITYRMIMKCCQNLINSRSECATLMEGLFDRCCNDGFVSKTELGMLRSSVPPSVLEKLFMSQKNTSIPFSWCRNVKPEFRPRTA